MNFINPKLKIFSQTIFTIFLFIFVIIFSLKLTLGSKSLYHFDLDHLKIEKNISLDKEEILSTYDYLIYYVNTPKPMEFKIPLLPSSREGATHFIEVKSLFTRLDFILFFSTIVVMFGIFLGLKYYDFTFLNWTSNLLFFACMSILAAFLINFDKCFTFFHKMLFNNNYWLLNPNTDPVINMLPEEYFFHCAILMLFLISIWFIILKVIFYKNKKMISN